MKKLVAIVFLGITLLGLGLPVQAEQALDQIVAVVNDDVITRSELDRALTIVAPQMNQNGTAVSKKVLEQQVLEQLINKKLQLQLAKTAGIKVTSAMVDEAIASIAKQNNISVNQLYEQLNHDGVSRKEYHDEIHDQMTIQRLQQAEVTTRFNVTPEEVDRFLQSKPWKQSEPKEYHLLDILLPFDEEHTSATDIAAAKKRAAAIADKLRKNKSIEAIKNQNLDLQVTDLGWRKLNDMPSPFITPVGKLGTNDVAGPIQTSNGIHLVKILGVNALGGAADYAPTREQAEQLLLQRKFNDAVQVWISKMRSQAFIEVKLPKQ